MVCHRPNCVKCSIPMVVAYRREGKKWVRCNWVCKRCGAVDHALMGEFPAHRKARIGQTMKF